MTPLKDRILVLPIKEKKTHSGLLVLGNSLQGNKGKVVLIGERVNYLKIGDTVLYHDNVGVEYKYNNADHLFLRTGEVYKEVIAII